MGKSLKNVLAILLCCAIALSLVGCGTSAPAGSAKPAGASAAPAAVKDTLTVTLSQDSGTLDPQFNNGWDCMSALRMIYEPLMETEADGKTTFVLATSIEKVSPTVWRVNLRKGVKFSNGNAFNADDVLFTIYRACHRPGASSLLTRVLSEKCKKIDDYTVEIVFDKFIVGQEQDSWGSIYMLDKESFDEKTATTKTMGTGPYTLTQQVINSQWQVTRRDDYWGTKPAFKTITFKFLSEDTQKVNAIETGTTDICAVPFQDISYVQKLKNMNVALSFSGQGKCVYMNIDKRSPFHNNDDARRAVSLAIDRQAVTTAAYSGYAKVSRMPISAGKFDEDPSYLDIGTYKTGQDLEKAKQLAISSGLVNKEILLINNGNLDSTAVAELVQADLKKIGVNAKIWTLDPGSWKNVIHDPTQWDMAIDFTMGTSVAKGYDMWYRLGGGGSYLTNDWAGSKEFAALNEKAVSEPDNAKRIPMVKRMTEILTDSMLWYGLCDLQTAVAYNKGLKNFSQKSDGTVVYYRLSW